MPPTPSSPRRVNLKGEPGEYFGNHRSGWAFAVAALAPAHDPRAIYLNTFIEKTFVWDPPAARPITEPWLGIIHIPPHVPPWFLAHQSNEALFAGAAWRASLPHCRGLFTLSQHHRRHLQTHGRLSVPVEALLHPTEEVSAKWSPEAFERNPRRCIIQVGWWLRVLHGIFELPACGLEKVFLRARPESFLDELVVKERDIREKQGLFKRSMYATARVADAVGPQEYDRLLSENIVFLNLYDASANNTILECIARNTPVLVNPISPVIEYLGEGYPLYYRSMNEAAAKAADMGLLRRAHEYLSTLAIKPRLTGDAFRESLLASGLLGPSA